MCSLSGIIHISSLNWAIYLDTTKQAYNDNLGKPFISLYNRAIDRVKKLSSIDNYKIEVSLSDEKNYAIANVIIYGKEK